MEGNQEEIRNKIQAANFKFIKGMKLTMDYEERDDGIYLIGIDENNVSYELAKIEHN